MTDGQIQKFEDAATGSFAIRHMDDLKRVATMMQLSGYFQDAGDVAKAGVKILAGLEYGIGPFAAMQGIHIIKGRPALSANLMAAAVKRHPRYGYRVREHSAEVCKIEFFEDGESLGVESFTMAEAKAAGLHQERDKQKNQWRDKHNWKTYPKNMLFARCLSNGVRFHCPDVFDCSTYIPEELGANVDGDGNVMEAQVIKMPVQAVPDPAVDDQAEKARKTALKRLFAIAKGTQYEGPDNLKAWMQVESLSALTAEQLKPWADNLEQWKSEQAH